MFCELSYKSWNFSFKSGTGMSVKPGNELALLHFWFPSLEISVFFKIWVFG